jgi:hypothetical protein
MNSSSPTWPHAPLVAEVSDVVMQGARMLAVTGAPGVGTSRFAAALEAELESRRARVLRVGRGEGGMLGLRALASQLLGRAEADFDADDIEALFDVLTTRSAPDERLVLIIDDAEVLGTDALGYFRLLSSIAIDEMPQIVFVGRSAFWDESMEPAQGALRELIADRWELEALSGTEAVAEPVTVAAAEPAPVSAAVSPDARTRGAFLPRLGVALAVVVLGAAAFWEATVHDNRMAAVARSVFRAGIVREAPPRSPGVQTTQVSAPVATGQAEASPKSTGNDQSWRLADILDKAVAADTAAPAPDVVAEASPDRMEPAEDPAAAEAPTVLVEASPDRMEPVAVIEEVAPVVLVEPSPDRMAPPMEAAPAVLAEASPDRMEPPAPAPSAAPVPPVLAEASPDRMAPYEMASLATREPKPITPPSVPRASAQELASLLTRGDAMLGLDDVVAARLFYERAAELGSARAATMLGKTYDPSFLASVQATGVTPDRKLAASWYRAAAARGDDEGRHLLAVLSGAR